MPAVAGPLSDAIDMLANMLAACPTWRACCAHPTASWATIAATAAGDPLEGDARSRIGAGSVIVQDAASYPKAIVRHLTDERIGRVSTAGYEGEGIKLMLLFFSVPEEYADDNGTLLVERASDAYIDMTNRFGVIRDELVSLSRTQTPDVMDIHEIEIGDSGECDEQRDPEGPAIVREYQCQFLISHYLGD